MASTKQINTVAPVKVAGMEVGSVMHDESGYFYRTKGASGLHKKGRDGEHRASIEEVKKDLPPGGTMPQVKAPQERKPAAAKPGSTPQEATTGKPGSKPAPQGHKPQAPAKEPAKAPVSSQEAPKAATAPTTLAQGLESLDTARKLPDAQAGIRAAVEKVDEAWSKPAPGVRFKLVETTTNLGTFFWLYVGFTFPAGFRWESGGILMADSLDKVDAFLAANSIALTDPTEQADTRNGTYTPNKGYIPHDDDNGQRNLL